MYWSVGGQYDSGNISVGAGDTAVTITGRTTYLTYDVTIVALSDHLPSPAAVVMITLGEPVNLSCMYHVDVCQIHTAVACALCRKLATEWEICGNKNIITAGSSTFFSC